MRSDFGGVGAAMVRMVEPGRGVQHQTSKAFAGDHRHFCRHPAAHGMTHEVRPIQPQCCDEPQIMDDQILHPADKRRRSAFAEAGVEWQIDPKPVGQTTCPFLPLDRCRSVERQDGRTPSDDFYDRVHGIDFELYRFEYHVKLPFGREPDYGWTIVSVEKECAANLPRDCVRTKSITCWPTVSS
ncbi:hypothetical protein V1290_004455 [Bradyrhizobium sp. AZCC 1578]